MKTILWTLTLTILGCLTAGSYGIANENIGGNIKLEVKASTITLTPTPTPELPTDVHKYIYEKFGEDYEEAIKIVKCESSFNTKAFNDNTWWGGVGQDRGLWQINNVYHPITDTCAYDAKCSTDYAYRIYLNNDKKFIRWTCGR